MSEKLNLLENGQKKCRELLCKCPSSVALQSVGKQIEYLIELEKGTHSDRSRLKDITIGVLTAREIEPLDADAAEIFYRIASAS
ncbi:immunity protein Tsi6 family protein [Pseudomonas cichorii]|uniref:Tsi6 domain-containing protein n=1 Tax=Pseudomonas cichorii TaxID=36746 RepID=A0ABQ1DKQ7_PSECI|nr:immunity protein Tsi6 family protein [Pseudomonas cichorii]QVE18666.1 hypothetical protein KGD89_08055 [Pseudomonas cichorii]GFM91588.1 hypothetical protein PSCICP_15600 [Pseudomonas cichorii]